MPAELKPTNAYWPNVISPKSTALLPLILGIVLISMPLNAAQLPEDLYAAGLYRHSTDGVDSTGSMLQLRTQVLGKASLGVRYQNEKIKGRAIDQPFLADSNTDQIEALSLESVILREHGLLALSFQQNQEAHHDITAFSTELTQHFLTGLQSLKLGLGYSEDKVSAPNTPLNGTIDRYSAYIGWLQTWSAVQKLYLDYQLITDKGPLGDPYAEAVINGNSLRAKYPDNRTSHSLSFRYQQYHAKNASHSYRYQYYKDNWQVSSHIISAEYQRSLNDTWHLHTHARFYTQGEASFYSNNNHTDQQFLAKDKELSDFHNAGIGFSLRRKLDILRDLVIKEAFLNFSYQANFFEFGDYESQGKPYNHQDSLVQLYLTAKL